MLGTNVFSIHSRDGGAITALEAAQIHVVDQPPSGQLGADGDMAVQISGDVYTKTNGTWILKFSIIGPEGPAGATGPAPEPTVINDISEITAAGFYVVQGS